MPPLIARALVFGTSAAVLVLEILAGRLLAPYVGVTLETFTGIIGTVLAGISLGAWLGGRLADRRAPRRLLAPLLIAGGVLTLAAPTIVGALGPAMRGGAPVQIVVLSGVAFFAPALVLSAITPVVVKIQLTDLGQTGAVVGRLSALGTAGAIFGTFLTGFVLLARFPSRPIVLVVGIALVVTGLGFSMRAGPATTIGLVGVVVGGGLLLAAPGPCQRETAYVCAVVESDQSRPGGRVLWLDTVRHSYVDLDDPTHLEFRYARLFGDAIDTFLVNPTPAVLYIGGGGFTFPQWFEATRPGSRNTVLEIDAALVDIATRDLGLTDSETERILVGDARMTLREVEDGTFDIAVGDAFGGFVVPWHLTTVEFLTELRAKLTDDGIYVLNLIDYPPLRFARAEAATLTDVFEEVLVVAPPEYLEGTRGGNFVFVASDARLDASRLAAAIAARGGTELVRAEAAGWAGDAPVLVDDYAPVDQMITRPD